MHRRRHSNKAQGKVPGDHQGDRGRKKMLAGSGRATCQCWGLVGGGPKWKSKVVLGKKSCTRKVTAGRENNMRACKEDLMTLGLGFW
jgi:hypothetical protein